MGSGHNQGIVGGKQKMENNAAPGEIVDEILRYQYSGKDVHTHTHVSYLLV